LQSLPLLPPLLYGFPSLVSQHLWVNSATPIRILAYYFLLFSDNSSSNPDYELLWHSLWIPRGPEYGFHIIYRSKTIPLFLQQRLNSTSAKLDLTSHPLNYSCLVHKQISLCWLLIEGPKRSGQMLRTGQSSSPRLHPYHLVL
jgi:hypothetical protein